jgi:hypothetical protein
MRRTRRHRVEDDFQGFLVRGVPVTLAVKKSGLNSECFSFRKEVHAARCLQRSDAKSQRKGEFHEEDSDFQRDCISSVPNGTIGCHRALYMIWRPRSATDGGVLSLLMASP